MEQVLNTVMMSVEEYEALRAQVSTLNKVVVHQDECYAGLERQLAAMTQERDELSHEFGTEHRLYLTCKHELAASQNREKVLRDALEMVDNAFTERRDITLEEREKIEEALALPQDTAALDELLANKSMNQRMK